MIELIGLDNNLCMLQENPVLLTSGHESGFVIFMTVFITEKIQIQMQNHVSLPEFQIYLQIQPSIGFAGIFFSLHIFVQ